MGNRTLARLRSVSRYSLLAAMIAVPAASIAQEVSGAGTITGHADEPRAQLLRTLAATLDAEAMARKAAGPYWTAMNPAEQARYVELFRRHLVALVGDLLPPQLPDLDGSATPVTLRGGDTLVRTTITLNGQPVPVGIRLRKGEKIVDLMVDSVSLVEAKRSEIMSLAGRGGVEAMIQALAEKSGGVAVDLPAASPAAAPADAVPSDVASIGSASIDSADGRSDPQPDTPAAATPAVVGQQTVYFDSGSAALSPDARSSLAAFARGLARPAAVSITGYADPAGPRERNVVLSRQRAEDVARELVAAGVAPEKIRIEARGETPPAGEPTVSEPTTGAERRRVEIVAFPTS